MTKYSYFLHLEMFISQRNVINRYRQQYKTGTMVSKETIKTFNHFNTLTKFTINPLKILSWVKGENHSTRGSAPLKT